MPVIFVDIAKFKCTSNLEYTTEIAYRPSYITSFTYIVYIMITTHSIYALATNANTNAAIEKATLEALLSSAAGAAAGGAAVVTA